DDPELAKGIEGCEVVPSRLSKEILPCAAGRAQRSGARLTKLTTRFTFFDSRSWLTIFLDTFSAYLRESSSMKRFTTTQAARLIGIHFDTLAHYVAVGKVPAPEMIPVGTGKRVVHLWTEAEIEHVRQLLPKIANGRKTRYQKLRAKQKAQAKSPAPRKKK